MLIRCCLLTLALLSVSVTSTGCASLIGAAFREGQDHGDRARYENKNFGEHFLDELAEDDDDDDCYHYHHCGC
jgi:hypothetical protein